MLAERHPIPLLDAVGFDEPSHTYTALGKRVPISVTKLTGRHFETFDADRVINTNFTKWRVNASSPYHAVIAKSASEEQAKAAIKSGWDAKGLEARTLGTRLHKIVEDLLNGEHVDRVVDDPVRAERRAFEAWRAEWAAERRLSPYRTELPLYGVDDEGVPVIAGMIDALFQDPDGELVLVDWKRAKPFSATAHESNRFARNGTGPCATLPDDSYWKYSLQLAVYARLLKLTAGLDVGTRRHLVRLTAEDGYEVIDADHERVDPVAHVLLHEELGVRLPVVKRPRE
jgi:hypothetical protein